jgi:hypothetical protein
MRHVLFLLVLGFVWPALAAPPADEKPTPGQQLDKLRQARREAAQRKRRIIFNNDGDDVIYTKKEPTAEALLALRTSPLLGSQVDSIFYSNSLCFGQALHQSRVMEPFLSTEYIFKDNGLPQLLQRGIDPIRVIVDFGHKHGIEVFWDMRMNDTHDVGLDGYGPYLRPRLKIDHPEYLVGTAQKQPRYGTWSSVNYAIPEVRAIAYRFFEEVCQRFDVDGVELDFFRHPCFFKSVAEGGRASRDELDQMTDLVRRIRWMTEREGLRRGRPILVAIRVPDSVEYCQGLGLDLETWLSEGLADILIGTCYFQCNPWEYLIELGHRHGVPVYPCLSESRVLGESRFSRQSIESYRARALRAWAAGADGIYLFNYFDPRGAVWRELGDPAALRKRDKLYFVTVRNGDPERYLASGRKHQHVPILTPSNPWPLPSDQSRDVVLKLDDDLAQADKNQATCHVWASAPYLEVKLNGQRLEKPAVKGEWLDFPVPPTLLRPVVNHLAFSSLPQQRAAGSTDQWTCVWEAPRLPGQPWRKMGFARDCVAEIRDGKLLLADRGTKPGSYAYFENRHAIRPDDEVIVEARARLLSGFSSVLVENGVAGEEILFFPDRVQVRSCGLRYLMPTTDAFHTYRIVIHRKDLKVYVNGQLRIDARGRFTSPAPNGRSGVAFGGANSGSLGEALWESVKIHNPAVSLLDVALSIRERR